MSNKPTLDEILVQAMAAFATKDEFEAFMLTRSTDSDYLEAKQHLTQLIADIVTEPNGNMMPPTIADGIRQRAKDRGIDL